MYNILRKFFISEKAHFAVSIHIITHDIPIINKAVLVQTGVSNVCLNQKHFDKKYSV